VQALSNLFGIALMVQLEQAVQDFALSCWTDGIAKLFPANFVESVVESPHCLETILPSVSADNSLVDSLVNATQFFDVVIGAVGIENQVVSLSKSSLAREH